MVSQVKIKTALLIAALLSAAPAQADTFAGRVIGVMDGDTILVLTAGYSQVKVRLAEIDAPESGMPYGAASKKALSWLCYKKPVRVEVTDIDRYKRSVGKVHCAGVNANRVQVETGMAWVYRRYAKDASLFALEDMAKSNKRGLWADANPTPPWEWRKASRGN